MSPRGVRGSSLPSKLASSALALVEGRFGEPVSDHTADGQWMGEGGLWQFLHKRRQFLHNRRH